MAHAILVALDSREGISIAVVFTSTVLSLEVEFLQLFKPSCDLPFWLFKLLNPFQKRRDLSLQGIGAPADRGGSDEGSTPRPATPSRLHSSFSLTWSECGSHMKSLAQPRPGSGRELHLLRTHWHQYQE